MQIKYNPQTPGQLPGQPAGGESMGDAFFFLRKWKKYFSRKKVLLTNLRIYRSLSFPSDSPA